MEFWNNPFFWAFLSMIGWFLAFLVVGSKRFGKSGVFGLFVVALVEIPRIILPLDFIKQPRFGNGTILLVVGFVVLIGSLVFGTPAVLIKPFTRPQKRRNFEQQVSMLWCVIQ